MIIRRVAGSSMTGLIEDGQLVVGLKVSPWIDFSEGDIVVAPYNNVQVIKSVDSVEDSLLWLRGTESGQRFPVTQDRWTEMYRVPYLYVLILKLYNRLR